MNKFNLWFNQLWYSKTQIPKYLQFLSQGYHLGQKLHQLWQKKRHNAGPHSLPVIVIGNLSVGGSGKTPLLISLAQYLSAQGIRVAVISRGYKSKTLHYPYLVQPTDNAETIGDEPALIAEKTQVPVMIAPKRLTAIATLAQQQLCDLILADDGLQHYAMPRDLEIVVIDGQRGFGNGHLLPLGPLREPIQRLATVDMIVINGPASASLLNTLSPYQNKTFHMQLQPHPPYALQQHDTLSMPLAAFAGIGNPQRFFQTLQSLNFNFTPYIFPDHYRYQAKDFAIPESCIIMTEKDAVKCKHLCEKPILVLPVTAQLEPQFWQTFMQHHIFQP